MLALVAVFSVLEAGQIDDVIEDGAHKVKKGLRLGGTLLNGGESLLEALQQLDVAATGVRNLFLQRRFWDSLQLVDEGVVAGGRLVGHSVGAGKGAHQRLLSFGALSAHCLDALLDGVDDHRAELLLSADAALALVGVDFVAQFGRLAAARF